MELLGMLSSAVAGVVESWDIRSNVLGNCGKIVKKHIIYGEDVY
jgi:hypothetical protein